MTGQRRADSYLRRLRVSDLPHHHDIRVGAKDRPKPRGECEADARVDGELRHVLHPVLDRVFDRDDLAAWIVDRMQERVECRRLTRSGGPGDEDRTVGASEHSAHVSQVGLGDARAPRAAETRLRGRAIGA